MSDAGPSHDQGAVEARLDALRADCVAAVAEGPLFRIKRGRRSACRALQDAAGAFDGAFASGDHLALLARMDVGADGETPDVVATDVVTPDGATPDGVTAGGAVFSELTPEDHDRWLRQVGQFSQSGGPGCSLYLAFGIVDLPETPERAAMQAPLLLVPARLSREAVSTDTVLTDPVLMDRGRWSHEIAVVGGPLIYNGILQDALMQDYGLILPRLGDGEAPSAYLTRVGELFDVLGDSGGAGLRKQVAFGLFDMRPAITIQDLDAARWPEGQAPWHDDVVARLLGVAPSPEILPPVEDLDPLLIHPVNAGQRAAIGAALAGNDLVVEGPVGSGRTQTIANLIAAGLAKGQKILLMAEAPRSLAAVRRRLEAGGLGDFCLGSSQDGALGAREQDIQCRLERLGNFAAVRPGEDPAEQLAGDETALGEHVSWLDGGAKRLGLTARQIFLAALEHRGLLGQTLPHGRDFAVSNVVSLDLAGMARVETALAQFVQAVGEARRDDEALADHPWHGVTRATLSPTDWSALADVLTTWQRAGAPVETALTSLAVQTGIGIARTPEMVTGLTALLAVLPEESGALYPDLMDRAGDPTVAREIKVLGGKLERLGVLEEQCAALFGQARGLPEAQVASLDGLLAEAEGLGSADRSLGELAQLGQVGGEAAQLIAELLPGFGALAARLGDTVTFSARGLRQLQGIIELAHAAPSAALSLSGSGAPRDDISVALAKAESEAEALRRVRRVLSEKFDLEKAPQPRVIANATRDLARGGPLRGLSSEWRRAEKVYRSVARSKRRPDRKQMQEDLERLLAYQEHLAAFARHVGYRQALGAHFRGVETDFAAFHSLLEWRHRVQAKANELGNGPVGSALLGLPEADVRALAALPKAIAPWYRAMVRLLEIWPDVAVVLAGADQEFSTLSGRLARIHDVLGRVGSGLDVVKPDLSVPLRAVRKGLGLLGKYGSAQRAVSETRLLAERRQDGGVPQELVLRRLNKTAAVVAQINKLSCGRELVAWLAEDPARIGRLRSDLAALQQVQQDWENAFDAFAELGHVEKDLWFAGVAPPHSLKGLHDRGMGALGAMDRLPDWIAYLRAAQALEDEGLSALGDLFESGALPADQIVLAYRARVYDAAARDVLIDRPRLATASGRDIDKLFDHMSETNRVMQEMARVSIAHDLDEAALAYRAAAGKDCFAAALEVGPALQALKPCFMMTPAEVAALDPEAVSFDLAIVDSGSGMGLAVGIGAAARAAQLVVVGQSGDDDGSDGDGTLDLMGSAKAGLACHQQLLVRYGVDHPGLFAFVNEQFHDGGLSLALSPDGGVVEQVGVEGICERGQNRVEGDAVVDAALDHMLTRPGCSLGIIAMTGKQARLIDEELRRRASALPAARAFLQAREAGLEPVRVWDAAMVPAEGRDNLLVSITFGPNNNGQLLQSFPGLYGPEGWRPLASIGSMARKRLSVFASLGAEDVLVGAETGVGVKALRDFLSFAADPAEPGEGQAAGGLMALIGAGLAREGLQVAPMPESGERCLGVLHPRKEGAFILGLVDAIPPDRAAWRQQAALAASGWALYRLYEPDCFKDLDGEIRRIVARIEAIQASEKRRERRGGLGDQVMAFKRAVMAGAGPGVDEAGEGPLPLTPQEARCSLVTLREHVIKPACPATDPAHGLLRDPMLDLLLAEVPRTPEAFRSAISVKQLQDTDAAQLEAYLSQVLEIVARIAA